MKLQKLVVPIALLAWVTIVVAALSFTPETEEENYGAITGAIVPAEVSTNVYVLAEGEIVATTQSDPESGEFVVDELPEGTYTVEIEPTSDEYESFVVEEVTVVADEINDLGELELERSPIE
jgi:hypothetical protein